jgi:polyisoprenoid-binding protein YceI
MQPSTRRAIGTFCSIDASDGELLAHAAVSGGTPIIGHSLTFSMNSWWATIWRHGTQPTAVELTVELKALELLQAHGAPVTPTRLEKTLVRLHALQAVAAGRYPQIVFFSDDIARRRDGYRLSGALQIRESSDCIIDLGVTDFGDTWRISAQFDIRQSDFGFKPISLLCGPTLVGDHTTVSFAANLTKETWPNR